MSLALTHSRCLDGTTALPVSVETHLSGGLPSFTIVGLPETAVRESRERVRSALINSGFEFPQRRITVNLAPGDIPKEGTRFDLAIALGILAASGQLPADALDQLEFVAELALDGRLRPVGTVLAAALAARAADRELVLAHADGAEAAIVEQACVRAAVSLGEVCRHVLGTVELSQVARPAAGAAAATADLADVHGQFQARRALEIAACGAHNLLLIGPPGTGKTMLASRLPGLLPPMTESEALDTAGIWSACGLRVCPERWRERPFRAPHHACSAAALVGGGRVPRPGEISLAHNGVLFLDELPEFDRRSLEALREPLESGCVTISRAARVNSFPARFLLVAAMNPCPCGYDGDPTVECRCTPDRIERYRGRISGPLSERIDMHLEIPRQAPVLPAAGTPRVESSADVRRRVAGTRALALDRQATLNGHLGLQGIERHCEPSGAGRRLLAMAADRLALSARGCHKVLRIARTVADLEASARIEERHVAEALRFRPSGRRRR